MKKIKWLQNINIAVLICIGVFILCISFIFKIPSPKGGLHIITYEVGLLVGVMCGIVSFILLCIFNRKK